MATRMVSALLPAASPATDVTVATMSSVTSMRPGRPPAPRWTRWAACRCRSASGRPPGPGGLLQVAHRPADPVLVHRHLDDRHRARSGRGRSPTLPSGTRCRSIRSAVHADGGHGGDAQPLVDLRAALVVDAGGHPATPNVSRASRAEMMLELSPLETAAKASARSMPACRSTSPVEAHPGDRDPGEVGAEPAERVGVLVDDRDRVPAGSRLWARVEPTRPHPMITTCTLSLPRCVTPRPVAFVVRACHVPAWSGDRRYSASEPP